MVQQKLEVYVKKYANDVPEEDSLLNTIKIPNNGKLKQVINKLPKSNYRDLSTESSDKLTYENNKIMSLTRNSNTMGSNSINYNSSLVDNPINLKGRYLAKSIKEHRSESRRKSTEPTANKYDKELSYRDYGYAIDDYSSSENHKLLVNRSFGSKHKRAESSLLKLKKLKADRVSLERFIEQK